MSTPSRLLHAMWHVIELIFFFSPLQLWMFDLYRNADRFWHEVSRANELCSSRSGSKVSIGIILFLRVYLMNNRDLRAMDDGMGEWRTAETYSSESCIFFGYLWRSFVHEKDKYLIINFPGTRCFSLDAQDNSWDKVRGGMQFSWRIDGVRRFWRNFLIAWGSCFGVFINWWGLCGGEATAIKLFNQIELITFIFKQKIF